MLSTVSLAVILICLLTGAILIWNQNTKTKSTTSGQLSITLHCSPSQITASDILLLVIKAILKHISGYSPSLQPGHLNTQTFELPSVHIDGKLSISESNIDTFNAAVKTQGLRRSVTTSEISPFFLVSQTVPLVISILAHRATPIKPLGAVNTRNIIEFHDPQFCRDGRAIRTAAEAGQLRYRADFGGSERPGHRRKRGVEFCIAIEVLRDEEVVMRQECWFLQFLSKTFEPKYIQPSKVESEVTGTIEDRSGTTFRMDFKDPKRWAASSKDYNPIHVSEIGARLFGFKSVIAHGNHIAALALQGLQQLNENGDQGPQREASKICWKTAQPFSLEVRFARPMVLPAEANTEWTLEKTGHGTSKLAFLISNKDKTCVEGVLAPINSRP